MGRGKRAGGQGSSGVPRPMADFNPTVSFEDDGSAVTVWLPELSLYGHGADFEAAKRDLVSEIEVYAEQFRASERLQQATNRRDHARLLELVSRAASEGRLDEVLFTEPAAAV